MLFVCTASVHTYSLFSDWPLLSTMAAIDGPQAHMLSLKVMRVSVGIYPS